MTIRICARLALVAGLGFSVTAHAALQGRDLDGNLSTFEAYYDTNLNITWLADANYAQTSGYDADGPSGYNADGRMTWSQANTWAANLSFTDGINVYDNWRLPNSSTDFGWNITSPSSEMAYMFYVNLGNPGYSTPAGVVSGCYISPEETCLDNVGPFSNLQANTYWTGLEYEYAAESTNAWGFHMGVGEQWPHYKEFRYYAWAVSPGDVAAAPEAQTYALMLAGLGLIAWRAQRR